MSTSICFAVEFHRTRIADLIVFGWNDWLDAQIDKLFADPISVVSFITAECNGFAVAIEQTFINFLEQCLHDCSASQRIWSFVDNPPRERPNT